MKLNELEVEDIKKVLKECEVFIEETQKIPGCAVMYQRLASKCYFTRKFLEDRQKLIDEIA